MTPRPGPAARHALRVLGLALAATAVLGACGRHADEAAPATPSRAATAGVPHPALTAIDAPFPEIALHLREIRGPNGGPREAVIEVASQRASYRVGQELFPGVVVESIEAEQVQLRFRARSRTLHLLDTTAGASAPVSTPSVAASVAPAPTSDGDDLRAQNRHIDIARLTTQQPMAADAFLREVRLEPSPRGGFVVREVLADSRYAQMGLRRDDVVHSLDSPEAAPVDERSMVALTQRSEIVLTISRGGQPLTLRHAMNRDAADGADARGDGR